MITTAQMYWLTRLDTINDVCFIAILICVIVFSFVSFVGFMIAYSMCREDKFIAWLKRSLKFVLFILAFCSIVCSFVPTTKEMAAIIILPKIANSEKVQQAGNKLYDLAVEWMDALKPKTNNGKDN